MTLASGPSFAEKQLRPLRRDGRLVNAMSVDIEEYFQVQALEKHFPREIWDRQALRVEANCNRILDIFAEYGVKSTFFTLGWVARRCPAVVRRLVAEGHELASHGSDHRRADAQTREEFRADVTAAKALLEDLGGVAVRGYRAPIFSIGAGNLWAFEVLAEAGYRYSSSVYPVARDFYGMPSAPRFAFYPLAGRDFEEYPMSTIRLGERNFPAGGGGFFRLLPFALSRAALARINRLDGQSGIFYFHPWEIDPDQPRAQGLSFKSRFRHYVNLSATEGRLRRLCRSFPWDRIDQVFETPP